MSVGEAIAYVLRQLHGGITLRNSKGTRVGFDIEKFRRAVAEYNEHDRQSRRAHRG